MFLKYDFHIHSCLSPCGDADMTPANIANMAALAGLEVVALSDHNSAKNTPAFLEAAERAGILALPALELTTSEEAHVLCILPDIKAALDFDRYVYERLPYIKNKADIFGSQLVMDSEDGVLCEEDKLLINATSIGIYETARLLDAYGGIAVPAHIDRNSFSVLSNLGSMPAEMGFHTAELTKEADIKKLKKEHPELEGVSILVNSDAHKLTSIYDGEYTLEADSLSPEAVIEALRKRKGLPIL
jgi:PHP family Zn ribbon phosphoesterase